MAEKVFTSIINHFSSFTALILALTFAVVINGAPLSRHNNTNDDDTLSPSDNTLVAKLLLQWSMYETYPNHRSEALALEVCVQITIHALIEYNIKSLFCIVARDGFLLNGVPYICQLYSFQFYTWTST